MGDERETRAVRNTDIPKLQRMYYVMQDIEQAEERRAWMRERMTNITSHLSGVPGGGGAKGGMDDAFSRISDAEEKQRMLVKRYTKELGSIRKIIEGIGNENMRTFVTLMYVDNVSGSEVRDRLHMTRRGFDRARDAIERAKDMKSVVWHERYILEDRT